MTHFFIYLEYLFVWCSRFKFRRGYGVHSPFAYNLIKGVFFEQSPYYAYAGIKKKWQETQPQEFLRIDFLLFRLANFCQPHHIIIFGDNTQCAGYALHKGCLKAQITYIKDDLTSLAETIHQHPEHLFLYFHHIEDIQTCYHIINKINAPSTIFIRDIGRNKSQKKWWKKIINHSQTNVCFDLYYAGIIFFNKKLNKQNYKICY